MGIAGKMLPGMVENSGRALLLRTSFGEGWFCIDHGGVRGSDDAGEKQVPLRLRRFGM